MQTTSRPASATRVAPPTAFRNFRARHPSGVWVPCANCGLEQPEAPDCAVCGAPLVEMAPPSPPLDTAGARPRETLLPRQALRPLKTPGYDREGRIELAVAADYRGGELSHAPSPWISLGVLALAGFLFFHAASWFFDFTRREVRAMSQVVDRLALPPTACASCEKPFRIFELRARPFYDPPSEQAQLFDPKRAAPSQRWVEQMRREVREAKAWAEEQRRLQEEEAERLRE